jgi:hypothetical protein
MKFMRNLYIHAIASSILVFSTQNVSAITVDGVTFNEGPTFVFAGTIQETQPLNVGQELAGYGSVANIDGSTGFCAGCELTFTFDGYTLAAVGDLDGQGDNDDFAFTGGTINFWKDSTPDFNGVTGITTASDSDSGTPWLTLTGDTFTQAGVTGSLISFDVDFSSIFNDGAGFFDVAGGVAAPYLDTNTFGDFGPFDIADDVSDFSFNSSFTRPLNPLDPAFPVQGNGQIQGAGQNIPEPSIVGLLALGLLGLGATAKRRTV